MKSTVKSMERPKIRVQDRVEDGMPIITDIIAFLDCPLEEETEIQTVS